MRSRFQSEEEKDKFGKIPEVPSHLRAGGGGTVRTGVTEAEQRVLEAGEDPALAGGIVGLPTEEEMIFTDPDDIAASEKAIEGLFGVIKKDWQESHTVAKQLSLSEGKPLLILFTNTPGPRSGGSPASAGLERELLARPDFSEWAGEHFVRLRLDFNVKDRNAADRDKQALALKKERYLESLKSRYKVKGFPTIMVIATDGSVVMNERGYRAGTDEYVWGLLRTAAINSAERQRVFEERLVKDGYRRWTGKNDLRLLARLAAYDEGELLLIGANGERYRTKESHLSKKDRAWIAEQKAKRAEKR
ncbi:hypothetical protein ACFSYE_08040 [Roseibacillus ishigakijimensis]